MLGSLLRAVFWLVVLAAVIVGVGSYLLGRHAPHQEAEPAAAATSGAMAETARERGAEIGERLGAAADRAGEAMSDGSLTVKIKSKMALDDLVHTRDIDVTTRDRVVTLTGRVTSAAEHQRVLQLARDTSGVKSVRDQLRVQ
jgi:hyperosmotically inducible periplasmic protein